MHPVIKLKRCRNCKGMFDASTACDATGEPNSKGFFCSKCGQARVLKIFEEHARIEENVRRNLWLSYRGWWKHYTPPLRWAKLLKSERDYCPYCGTRLPFDEQDKKKLRAMLDHMDPLSLGGEKTLLGTLFTAALAAIAEKETCFLSIGYQI